MIEVALTAGMAAFAVTTAVVDTTLFAWYRRWGAWASRQRRWLYVAHLPVIASACPTCFSVWAALPFAAIACITWQEFLLLWFSGAGGSMLFYSLLLRLDSSEPSIESAVKQHLLDDRKTEPPDPFTAEAYTQTGDEPS